MTGMIPDDIIAQVREQIDIVDLVSSYVQLKHSGANHLGLCPFHTEKTPSFNVNSTRQIFHCFGCGVGGNVFNFLMRMEGLSFPQAVRQLAEQVGIDIPKEEPNANEIKRRQQRATLEHIYEVATKFYHQLLINDPRASSARGYIRRRGFNSEAVRRFRLGYAPEGWDNLSKHLKQENIDPEQAKQLGLIRAGRDDRPDYDMFRQRLLFPIDDPLGHIVAFGGRVLDDSLPKYINSPESPLYHKSKVLYGLYQAKDQMRRQRKVVVVEGYFDHLALVQAGIENVVATCGTALTSEHATILQRYVDQVILLFDQDNAGQKACFKAMPVLLKAGLQVQTITLPQGDDPDSYVKREGAEQFINRLDSARPAVEFHMDTLLSKSGNNATEQTQAINEILMMLHWVPSEIERDLHLNTLAQRCGVKRDILSNQLDRTSASANEVRPKIQTRYAPLAEEPPAQQLDYAANFIGQQPEQPIASAMVTKAQKWLLSLMIADAQVSQRATTLGLKDLFENTDCFYLAELIHNAWQQQHAPAEWLLDHCEDSQRQTLLTQLLISGKELPDENIEQIFDDCRLAVKQSQLKQRRATLHTLMREAEQQNDSERQLACLQELTQLNRQLKNKNL